MNAARTAAGVGKDLDFHAALRDYVECAPGLATPTHRRAGTQVTPLEGLLEGFKVSPFQARKQVDVGQANHGRPILHVAGHAASMSTPTCTVVSPVACSTSTRKARCASNPPRSSLRLRSVPCNDGRAARTRRDRLRVSNPREVRLRFSHRRTLLGLL